MIPAEVEITFNMVCKHEATGGIYAVICPPSYACQMKLGSRADAKWVPAVIYCPHNGALKSGTFVRDEETFRKNFSVHKEGS